MQPNFLTQFFAELLDGNFNLLNLHLLALIKSSLLVIFLSISVYLDLKFRKVYNWFNLSFFSVGLLLSTLIAISQHTFVPVWTSLQGIGVAFLVLIIPFAIRLYQGGDFKLMLAVGAWLGPNATLYACLYGIAFGGLLGLLMYFLFVDQKTKQRIEQNLKFSYFTQEKPNVSESSQKNHVPMALAFAIGSCLAYFKPY
jgi:Flp pilus assembly protein protease CpaA